MTTLSYIEMCDQITIKTLKFTLNPDDAWEKFDKSLKEIICKEWNEVKYLDDRGDLNPDVSKIPNNSGGIYTFVLKPNIIPDTHLYILYIGRARLTDFQNLRKRCKEYIKDENRPRIGNMMNKWGQHLYIRYLPLDDNGTIDRLEAELIEAISPPINSDYPKKQTRMARKAAF